VRPTDGVRDPGPARRGGPPGGQLPDEDGAEAHQRGERTSRLRGGELTVAVASTADDMVEAVRAWLEEFLREAPETADRDT
jgi:hypothetical protein